MEIRKLIITCGLILLCTTALAQQPRQWSIMFYRGTTAEESLGQVLQDKYTGIGETVYSAEIAYSLAEKNSILRFFQPLINKIQLAGNFAIRNFHGDNDPETDLYLVIRHNRFPWQRYLSTSIAVGDGISYAFHTPPAENGYTGNSSQRMLNYLMFEITLGLPQFPNLQLVGRIHHRSAVFGLYCNRKKKAGSNNIGIGIRYYFS